MTPDSGGVASISGVRPVALPIAARVEALYKRHHVLVYKLALRYARGNSAWAEDVTQEVFLALFDVLDRLDDRDGLEPWFYRVTTNRCLNRLRRERVRQAAPVRWLLGAKTKDPVDPERLAAAREGLDRAWGALDALTPKERVAFCMYYLDGKLLTEIGAVIGHSKGYVCKLIKRAETHVRAAGWGVPGDA
jgi:RNA polymerase sigma-70 factor (ECF subfamily)